jgi:outer membrane lipoprotein-sorting protein
MNENRNGKHDDLQRNVEKLLTRARPELTMPQASKDRILRALLEEAAEQPAMQSFTLRKGRAAMMSTRWSWLTAAAAALLLGVFLFWPGGLQNGVAWADVVQHLNRIESVIARVTIDDTPPGGARKTGFAVLFQKDPGLSRTEIYASSEAAGGDPEEWPFSPDEAESIVITSSGRDEAVVVRMSPREKVAHRTTLSFAGAARDARSAMPRDMVAASWARLKEIASDRTRVIGEREIDGLSTVGFEADIGELFGDSALPRLRGTVHVWAALGTGEPVEIELDFRDERGWHHLTRFWDLQWNARLADDLFRIPDAGDWRILEERDHRAEFSKTTLRAGVTLSVGPPDGPAVFTERDVEAVVSGRMIQSAGDASPRTMIFLTATPEGEAKLRAYTAEHLGESLVLDFNGETRFQIRIGGVVGKEMQLDVTALGKTLAEFEAAYLID